MITAVPSPYLPAPFDDKVRATKHLLIAHLTKPRRRTGRGLGYPRPGPVRRPFFVKYILSYFGVGSPGL
jgi:hypothetical protein